MAYDFIYIMIYDLNYSNYLNNILVLRKNAKGHDHESRKGLINEALSLGLVPRGNRG